MTKLFGAVWLSWILMGGQGDWLAQVSTLRLEYGDWTVALELPETWVENQPAPADGVQFRSVAQPETVPGDWQQVTLQFRPLSTPLGDLSAEDAVGRYLEFWAAALPLQSLYPPSDFSEIVQFRWGNYPGAVFVAYSAGEDGQQAYYARWWGLGVSDDTILLIEQGMALPLATPPDPAILAQWDKMLGQISLNDNPLLLTGAYFTLSRITDPYPQTEANLAALRLLNGVEIRLAAPPQWHRRLITTNAHYPTTYFLENDVRGLTEGEALTGGVIQVSLMDETYLQGVFNSATLPAELAISYANTMLGAAQTGLTPGNPQGFDWTPDHFGLILPVHYADGTQQELILIEAAPNLILLTFYAPETRWSSLLPTWHNILASLIVNGETLPPLNLEILGNS